MKPEPLDDEQLLTILEAEAHDAASWHDSDLAKHQAEAMRRYFGELYGDEVPGRSQVVTHDIEDTINWLMPDLLRVFLASDELVSIEPASQEDEQPIGEGTSRTMCELQADYLSHVFFEDCEGEKVLHDFAFDGLLGRIGVVRVIWCDPYPTPPYVLEGVGPESLQKMLGDPEYEILEAEQGGTPEQTTFDLKVRRVPRMGHAKVVNVPPEEFLIPRRARSLDDATYVGQRYLVYLRELIRDYPDRQEELETGEGPKREEDDERYTARHQGWASPAYGVRDSVDARAQVEVHEEFVRCDYDGDGTVEWRYVKRCGRVILENEVALEHDFVAWSPVRVAHRLIGRSMVDLIADLQKIRTVISRRMLDALALSTAPRTYVNVDQVSEETIDDILDNDIGGVIRGKGPASEVLQVIPMQDISGSALQALEHWDQRVEQSSGVTRHAQGLDPSALNKTASGIELLQAAAKTRIEMIARWLGIAVQDVFHLLLKKVVRHQDGARVMKLKGQWTEVDPRRWSDDVAVRIHVGMSAASRAQQVANLSMIASRQEQILLNAGPGNPVVNLRQYRNTLARLTDAMGYKDSTRFWSDVPEDWQPPEPGPDPKQAEIEGKLQLEQAKMQIEAQRDQGKMQLEREIAEMRLQSEREIAHMRLQAETQLAREKAAREMQLERERMNMQETLGRAKLNGESSKMGATRFGGEVG